MNDWVKQSFWHGNPELGFESWMKKVQGIPVYLFGKEGYGKNRPCRDINGNITHYQDFSDWSYCVSAGANSSRSYSGGFYPIVPTSAQEAMSILDNKKLIK